MRKPRVNLRRAWVRNKRTSGNKRSTLVLFWYNGSAMLVTFDPRRCTTHQHEPSQDRVQCKAKQLKSIGVLPKIQPIAITNPIGVLSIAFRFGADPWQKQLFAVVQFSILIRWTSNLLHWPITTRLPRSLSAAYRFIIKAKFETAHLLNID